MKHLDLFSGIGGFALAAQMVWGDDYENIAFCDNNEFCQEVLAKNFPGCIIIGDIRDVTQDTIGRRLQEAQEQRRFGNERNTRTGDGDGLHLLTGGFPCQPFSCAGKRGGQNDDRYLWPEMLRVISAFKPRWVIGENVGNFAAMAQYDCSPPMEKDGSATGNLGDTFGRLGRGIADECVASLEAEDYEVQVLLIPACSIQAPHERTRTWIVANRKSGRDAAGKPERHGSRQPTREIGNNDSPAADSPSERPCGRFTHEAEQQSGLHRENIQPDWQRDWREVAFATCVHRVDDGLPRRLVRLPSGRTISQSRWRTEALKAYGNAIVPQVAMEIMKAIKEVDNET